MNKRSAPRPVHLPRDVADKISNLIVAAGPFRANPICPSH